MDGFIVEMGTEAMRLLGMGEMNDGCNKKVDAMKSVARSGWK